MATRKQTGPGSYVTTFDNPLVCPPGSLVHIAEQDMRIKAIVGGKIILDEPIIIDGESVTEIPI